MDNLSLGAGALAGIFLAFVLNAVWFLPRAVEQGRVLERAAAAAEAIHRIQELEQSNAKFRSLPSRDRCLVLMRDSGLPDSECDQR